MCAGEVRGVVSNVDSDGLPAPFAGNVKKAADVAAHFDHICARGQQRPVHRFLPAVRLDVRAQHALHHERGVGVVFEIGRLVFASDEYVASAADQNLGVAAARDIRAVLLLRRVESAVHARREEVAAQLDFLRDPLTRDEKFEVRARARRAWHHRITT